MKKIYFGLLILLPSINTSCLDTCSDLGNTFKKMEAKNYFAQDDRLSVFVDFESIKTLPVEYFSKSVISHSKEIDTVYFVSNKRMIVEVYSSEFREESQEKTLEIILEMPDRKDYTDCFKFSEDIYYDDISLTLKKETFTVYSVGIKDWSETVIKK